MSVDSGTNPHQPSPALSNAVVLFDGVCNLCNHSVQFILQRDPHGYFRFASLQSPVAQHLLRTHGLSPNRLESVILIEAGRAYSHSDAALRIASHLGSAWPALGVLWIVPRFVRDGIYNWIAANRYRWFGKREECMLPTPELRQRFLE